MSNPPGIKTSEPDDASCIRSTHWATLQFTMQFASVVCLLWYLFVSMKMTIVEVLLATMGMTILWLPIASAVYLFTIGQFENRLDRITFCAISSYALTTAMYFGLGVASLWLPGIERSFCALLILILTLSCLTAWYKGYLGAVRLIRNKRAPWQLDWTLILLIAVSSLVTVRYKTLFEFIPDSRTYLLKTSADQTYFTSIAYECQRHTPMLQTPYRAGQASRAYHMFSHLTTSLVGRFTFQPDLIRAHLTYEYTFIEWFMLLALFCIVRQMTGSRSAGYLAVALMFIGAIPVPRMCDESALNYMYFCFWPQSSSMIEPVLMTSPQHFSAGLLNYGIILGIGAITRKFCRHEPADRIAWVIASLGAIMLRFRVQTFLPLFPGLLIVLAYLFAKTRNRSYLLASMTAIGLVIALVLEMQLSVYLPSTARLSLGNNLIAFKHSFLNSWPGSRLLAGNLMSLLPKDSAGFQWTWQIVSATAFSALNIVGIPFLVATNVFLRSQQPRSRFDGASFLIFWMIACSVIGSIVLAANYDDWSVGGQMLLHVNWYLYPVAIAGIWEMRAWIPSAFLASCVANLTFVYFLIVSAFVWQCVRPPSLLEQQIRRDECFVTADELESMQYIRKSLPEQAVILSQPALCQPSCVFSGISGRRAYLEYFPSIEQSIVTGPEGERSRQQRIASLWSTQSDDEFCHLVPDVVTHIVEVARQPLRIESPTCLQLEWISSNAEVRIWKVVR